VKVTSLGRPCIFGFGLGTDSRPKSEVRPLSYSLSCVCPALFSGICIGAGLDGLGGFGGCLSISDSCRDGAKGEGGISDPAGGPCELGWVSL
jgi:hypothetical protein